MHGLPQIETIGFGWFEVSGPQPRPLPARHHDCLHLVTSVPRLQHVLPERHQCDRRPPSRRSTAASRLPHASPSRSPRLAYRSQVATFPEQVDPKLVPAPEHERRRRRARRGRGPGSRARPTAGGRRARAGSRPASIISRSASGSAILPKRGLDVPAPREEAVDLVGDPGDAEDDRRRPAVAVVGGEQEQRRRPGSAPAARASARSAAGRAVRGRRGRSFPLRRRGSGGGASAPCELRRAYAHAGRICVVPERLRIPGFVDAHTHAFQRALRGRAGGGDFWAWRDEMIAEAERQTPETVRRGYAETYRELRAAGYTAVGEFHYLGLDGGARRARRGRGGRRRLRPAPRRLRARRQRRGSGRSRSPTYLRELEQLRAGGRARRRRPPLRPRLPGATGSSSSAPTRPPSACRCTSTPTSSRARSRSASPSTAAGRSSCSRARAASARTRPSSTPRTPTATSSTCSRDARRADLRLPDDRGRPRRRLRPGRPHLPPLDRHVHRQRLERPHRPARGAARARGDRPPPDRDARRGPGLVAARVSAPTRAPRRSGSRSGPTSRSTSLTRSLRGVAEADLLDALVLGCGADVLVPTG